MDMSAAAAPDAAAAMQALLLDKSVPIASEVLQK